MRLLQKFKKQSSFPSFIEQNLQLSLASSLATCLRALKNKPQLSTAYVGTECLALSEGLTELGFTFQDPHTAFFGTSPSDIFHPYNPREKVYENTFDVIFSADALDRRRQQATVINLPFFARAVQKALHSIEKKHFLTCLNPQKLSILAALCYLIPSTGTVIEAGSYQCGSTIFMAKLLQALGKHYSLYALDTFEGMPPATLKDKLDTLFYDSGLFTNNPLPAVSARIQKEKLSKKIHLVKGNITETIATLTPPNCRFLFLDTDQYAGTKSGLEAAARLKIPYILVDDTSLKSIQAAIAEFLAENPQYSHKPLITNFDLIFV